MGFRVYMRLQFEICFVGWLWGIKECNGCASLENMKIRKMVILMRLHMVLEWKLLINLWKVLNVKWNNIFAID